MKKTSGKLQKEEIKLYRKLLTLIRKKNKEIFSRFKKLGRVPSNDLDIKQIVQPLEEVIEDYAEIVIENTEEAIRRGIARAVRLLPTTEAKREFKIDFEFLEEFSPLIAQQIKEKTFVASEKTIRRLIGNLMENLRESYEAGFGYSKSAERLNEVFVNMETYELERVARTEIASAENLGMYESEIELGVEYHKWRTARDNIVRDSHQELEGEIVRVGEPFSNGLLYPGDRSGALEEFINCFVGDTLVTAIETKRIFRRFYKGEMITITTASGNKLTGTPNHPILTSNGWIPLNRLNLGNKVISTRGNIRGSFVNPNNNYIKTRIEEIYASSSKLLSEKRVSFKTGDFHTDRGGSEYIDIINMDSFLRDNTDIVFSQFINKISFPLTNILEGFFSGISSHNPFFNIDNPTSNSVMCLFYEPLSFNQRSLSHSNIHRFRTISGRDITFGKIPINNISGNIKLFGKGFNRFPFLIQLYNFLIRQNNIIKFGINRDTVISESFPDNFIGDTIFFSDGLNRIPIPVTTDNIINIESNNFRGYVYNLQTKDNMYISNNIITHNCRCTTVPVILPEGYTAPALPYFYESDLIKVEDSK